MAQSKNQHLHCMSLVGQVGAPLYVVLILTLGHSDGAAPPGTLVIPALEGKAAMKPIWPCT